MRKKNKKPKLFAPKKKPPSRKKRLLVGTVLALGALGLAGQLEKGRDAQ